MCLSTANCPPKPNTKLETDVLPIIFAPVQPLQFTEDEVLAIPSLPNTETFFTLGNGNMATASTPMEVYCASMVLPRLMYLSLPKEVI